MQVIKKMFHLSLINIKIHIFAKVNYFFNHNHQI